MKHEYLNEYNPDHFVTPRRSDPPWKPGESFPTDYSVAIIVMVIAMLALFGVWWTEGGL
jgi:hypothetical protein